MAEVRNTVDEVKKEGKAVEKEVEGLLGEPPPEPLLPFSQWRCLWDYKAANDPKKSEPYAYLEIFIDKAKGLAAADINGLSDPFVQICVDDHPLEGMKTKCIARTLAPTWAEKFKVPIYQPLSIVTLQVYDADFGTSLGALDFLGLDDDFIGFVDLQVNKFPFNHEIEGWFDLGTEDDFEDSIMKRMAQEETPFGGGTIHLSMNLIINNPKDEFFALTLPKPSTGHGYPPLSLPNVYKAAIEITELSDNLSKKIVAKIDELKNNVTGIWVFALFFIWHPDMILPSIAIIFALHTVYHNKGVFVKFIENMRKKKRTTSKEHFKAGVHAVMAANRIDHLQKERKAELEQKLLDGENLENGERRHLGHVKTKEELDAEEAVAKIASTLETVQQFIPAEQQVLLRSTENSLNSVTSLIHTIEDLMEGVDPSQALAVTAGMIVGSILLLLLRDFQYITMQIGLSVGVSAAFWQASTLGRLTFAIQTLRKEPAKVSVPVEVIMEDHHHTNGSDAVAVPPETANLPVEEKENVAAAAERIRQRNEQKLKEGKPGPTLAELDASPSAKPAASSIENTPASRARSPTPHRLSAAQTTALMLGGVRGDESFRSSNDHQYEAYSYTAPAWCEDCGAFLWGVNGQGLRCKLCNRDVCPTCSRDAEGTCAGKVRVRKKPPEQKSSAFQCCSRYMPTPGDKKDDPVLKADVPKPKDSGRKK